MDGTTRAYLRACAGLRSGQDERTLSSMRRWLAVMGVLVSVDGCSGGATGAASTAAPGVGWGNCSTHSPGTDGTEFDGVWLCCDTPGTTGDVCVQPVVDCVINGVDNSAQCGVTKGVDGNGFLPGAGIHFEGQTCDEWHFPTGPCTSGTVCTVTQSSATYTGTCR